MDCHIIVLYISISIIQSSAHWTYWHLVSSIYTWSLGFSSQHCSYQLDLFGKCRFLLFSERQLHWAQFCLCVLVCFASTCCKLWALCMLRQSALSSRELIVTLCNLLSIEFGPFFILKLGPAGPVDHPLNLLIPLEYNAPSRDEFSLAQIKTWLSKCKVLWP